MVKLQHYKKQFKVSIPREYIEKVRWKKGDVLTITFNGEGDLVLSKVGG